MLQGLQLRPRAGQGLACAHLWSGRWGRDGDPNRLTPAAPALPTTDLLSFSVAPENCLQLCPSSFGLLRQECGSSHFKSSPLLPRAGVGCLLSLSRSGIWSTACGWTAVQPGTAAPAEGEGLVESGRRGQKGSRPSVAPHLLAAHGTAWPGMETVRPIPGGTRQGRTWGRASQEAAQSWGDRQALTSVVSG